MASFVARHGMVASGNNGSGPADREMWSCHSAKFAGRNVGWFTPADQRLDWCSDDVGGLAP